MRSINRMTRKKQGKMKKNKQKKSLLSSFIKTCKTFSEAFPILLGVILLVGLFRECMSSEFISSLFTGRMLTDTAIGSIIGSVSAGNPVNSYIIGGELIKNDVSFFAVTSFIIAWVTVGLIQLPAEAAFLGKRFAVARNTISFMLCFVVTILVVITIGILQ